MQFSPLVLLLFTLAAAASSSLIFRNGNIRAELAESDLLDFESLLECLSEQGLSLKDLDLDSFRKASPAFQQAFIALVGRDNLPRGALEAVTQTPTVPLPEAAPCLPNPEANVGEAAQPKEPQTGEQVESVEPQTKADISNQSEEIPSASVSSTQERVDTLDEVPSKGQPADTETPFQDKPSEPLTEDAPTNAGPGTTQNGNKPDEVSPPTETSAPEEETAESPNALEFSSGGIRKLISLADLQDVTLSDIEEYLGGGEGLSLKDLQLESLTKASPELRLAYLKLVYPKAAQRRQLPLDIRSTLQPGEYPDPEPPKPPKPELSELAKQVIARVQQVRNMHNTIFQRVNNQVSLGMVKLVAERWDL